MCRDLALWCRRLQAWGGTRGGKTGKSILLRLMASQDKKLMGN